MLTTHRIVRDYEKYIARQLKRGTTRQELNISWLKKNELELKRQVNELRDSIRQNWTTTGQELGKELADSTAAAQEMFTQYVRMAAEREEWWSSQLERERARAGVWEESLQIAAKEGEELEAELKRRGRARGRQRRSMEGSWSFAEAGPASTIKINKKQLVKAVFQDDFSGDEL